MFRLLWQDPIAHTAWLGTATKSAIAEKSNWKNQSLFGSQSIKIRSHEHQWTCYNFPTIHVRMIENDFA